MMMAPEMYKKVSKHSSQSSTQKGNDMNYQPIHAAEKPHLKDWRLTEDCIRLDTKVTSNYKAQLPPLTECLKV